MALVRCETCDRQRVASYSHLTASGWVSRLVHAACEVWLCPECGAEHRTAVEWRITKRGRRVRVEEVA